MTFESNPTKKFSVLGNKSAYDITGGSYNFKKIIEVTGAEILTGFLLRYIYFIDKQYRKKLTVPEIPFSEIKKRGAQMYKGEKY